MSDEVFGIFSIKITAKDLRRVKSQEGQGPGFLRYYFLLSFTKPNYEYLKEKIAISDPVSMFPEFIKQVKL